MKKLIYILSAVFLLTAVSCEEKLDDKSIFDTSAPERNEFDQWLLENYVYPYNIDVKYRLEDIESNMTYDLAPADINHSITMAKIIKYVWLEAYDEVAGIDFTRAYVPKQILLVGSPAYDPNQGTMELGTAEGGLKVILYMVNEIGEMRDNIDDLNTYYFRTMHHEFSHILHMTIPYDPTFETITESAYIGSDWYTMDDSTAHRRGFVSPYAMDKPEEDFVEIIAHYVTHDETWWNALLADAQETGADLINQKFNIVRDYLSDIWDININELREVVLRRESEIDELDLEHL